METARTNHLQLVHAPTMSSEKQPNLFVVGAVKGGTTSLYNYLRQHPDIFLTPIKETHFFAFEDLVPGKFTPEYARDTKLDIEVYLKQKVRPLLHTAVVSDWSHYEALYSEAEGFKVKGEVCPSYAICPSTAERIHKHAPSANIVFMLRNPIERAWSHYLMNLREGKTIEKDFIQEVFLDNNADERGWGVNHQYLELGLYHKQVKRYSDLFPESQIHVILQEEFKANTEAELSALFQKLSLHPIEIDFSQKHNQAQLPRWSWLNKLLVSTGAIKLLKGWFNKEQRQKLAQVLYSSKKLPKLTHEQRLRLHAFYKDDISMLSSLLHKDLSQVWGLK